MSYKCPSRPRRRFLFFWHVGQPHEWIFIRIYKFMPGVSKEFTADERCIHCKLNQRRSFVEADELMSYGYTAAQLDAFDCDSYQAEKMPMPEGHQLPETRTKDIGPYPYQPWEERARSAEAALFELVFLKRHKDACGKDEDYQRRQPIAWEKAEAHLKKYPYAGSPDL